MRITHKMLVELEACDKELADFDREWPDGVSITRKNCLRAAELGLGIDWLACRVLTGDARKAYDSAVRKTLVDYRYAGGAWKEFRKAIAIAFWRAVRRMESE